MKRILPTLFFCFLFQTSVEAQTKESFQEYRNRVRREMNEYRQDQRNRFEEFRRKRNEEFAKFVRREWKPVEKNPHISRPKDEEVRPLKVPDVLPAPEPPAPVIIKEVIKTPAPLPQPQPVEPIEELTPKLTTADENFHNFTFFGLETKVRVDALVPFKLKSVSENGVADAWLELSKPGWTNLIADCLELREIYKLCDWAYLMMIDAMAQSFCGKGTNEATLLTAYVYCQSGYRMRLGHSGGKLYMLYSSSHIIYEKSYYTLDGEHYYVFGNPSSGSMKICNQKFPKESSMSLMIRTEQMFSPFASKKVEMQSGRYPEMKISVGVSDNLLDFYSTFPTSTIGDNVVSRWAIYANTPLSTDVKNQIYPSFRKILKGLSEREAVERLLHYVQTSFKYEYDDKVWGNDRAFFAEETLHYPYSDCEDRSILFSRLVRDLVGLQVCLVYYPGHLATAVCFKDDVEGDYLTLSGKRFIVCDPTYTNAPVGLTMPGMNNAEATVIVLE